MPRTLERFPPGGVLWAGQAQDTSAERALQAFFNSRGIIPETAQSGQVLDLGDGAVLRVVSTSESGAALLLDWGSFRALLPVGMDEEMLEDMLDDPEIGPVSGLLLADGGSVELNPPEWIDKLHPQMVLLSVVAGDRDGRPDAEALEAVEGCTLLRTDRNGWIELTTDGQQLWVEVERR